MSEGAVGRDLSCKLRPANQRNIWGKDIHKENERMKEEREEKKKKN